ncbi:MAG: hypothetical protein AVDCRST_MAG47-87, partial [uncultured Nocardioidaceae bacterium]
WDEVGCRCTHERAREPVRRNPRRPSREAQGRESTAGSGHRSTPDRPGPVSSWSGARTRPAGGRDGSCTPRSCDPVCGRPSRSGSQPTCCRPP